MQPLQRATKLWKFHVERSDNRREYRLFCDNGEFLMYAKCSKDFNRVEFFMYDPSEKENNLYDPLRPAFSMECDASRADWTLFQERCDQCRHSPKHSRCSCQGRQTLLT